MTEPTTARPQIDPTLRVILDAFPLTFTADDGVEVARAKLRQLKTPPEMLPRARPRAGSTACRLALTGT